MKAELLRNIYSKGNELDSYSVALFNVVNEGSSLFKNPDGEPVHCFTGTGYGFPELRHGDSIIMEMDGVWEKNAKYGWQFAISSFREIVPPTPEGLKAYLSRTIKGIGPRTAASIYKAFGDNTADILDNHPERLAEVKGISPRKAKYIGEQVYATRRARDVICYLAPYKISIKVCNQIVKKFENDSMRIIREEPYSLAELQGFGFKTCDRIAAANGLSPTSPERIKAALLHVLKSMEQAEGHLCLLIPDWFSATAALLKSLPFATAAQLYADQQMLVEAATALQQEQKVFFWSQKGDDSRVKFVYSFAAMKAEVQTTRWLTALRSAPIKNISTAKLERCVRAAELQCDAQLSDEQREAVMTCLNNNVTIITGGPGTGKTTMLRVTLTVYAMLNQGSTVTLCAPTGKAARRMSESTGYEATTIHRALGISDEFSETMPLHTDFVVVDEFSMVDIFLAAKLFESLTPGTKVLMVGDVDQLPSVGPGAVLSEMISSRCLPCVRLTKVFRQKGTSRVTVNAAHIRNGVAELEYGDDFIFIETSDQDTAAKAIVNSYLKELSDGVAMEDMVILSPRRELLPTSAYVLAERVRDCVNPQSTAILQMERCNNIYRLGDRVIQLKNTDMVSNGDMGVIVRMMPGNTEDPPMLVVDYGEGRLVEYTTDDLDHLRLAYACTIHKSQGSEFDVVIMSLSSTYGRMLQRNLVYTGITRAKRKVIIVGDKKALSTAIKTVNAHSRRTMLAYRLREAANNTK